MLCIDDFFKLWDSIFIALEQKIHIGTYTYTHTHIYIYIIVNLNHCAQNNMFTAKYVRVLRLVNQLVANLFLKSASKYTMLFLGVGWNTSIAKMGSWCFELISRKELRNDWKRIFSIGILFYMWFYCMLEWYNY